MCTWAGVNCVKNGRGIETVVEISLPSNNLRGNVPGLVYYLPSLTVLNLEDNDVALSFGDIGAAKSLLALYVGSTGIVSLEGLGQASKLRILNIAGNSFFGEEIPMELSNLTDLEVLDMSQCGFVGALPPFIGEWTNLTSLTATNNGFEGALPGSIFSLTGLKTLILSDNNFFGTLPNSLENLTSIETLALDKRAKIGSGFR